MRLRLQCASGRFILTLDDGATLHDLQLAVATKVQVPPTQQLLKSGYPARAIDSAADEDTPLSNLGVTSGETVVLEVLETTGHTTDTRETAATVADPFARPPAAPGITATGDVQPPAASSSTMFRKRDRVLYQNAETGRWVAATIAAVDLDDRMEPFYTILVDGSDRERQTIGSRLKAAPPTSNPRVGIGSGDGGAENLPGVATGTTTTPTPTDSRDTAAAAAALDALLAMGFSGAQAAAGLQASGGDLTGAVDWCVAGGSATVLPSHRDPTSSSQSFGSDSSSSSSPSSSSSSSSSLSATAVEPHSSSGEARREQRMVRRVVAADNNCLFTALAYLFKGDEHPTGRASSAASADRDAKEVDPRHDPSQAMALRRIAAERILGDPDAYPAAVLGKDPPVYASWIQKRSSWGGEIELHVLASYFRAHLIAVDIQTLRCYRYGSGERSAYLIFDGAHYDALVLGWPDGDAVACAGREATEQRIFFPTATGAAAAGADWAEAAAVEVARAARERRQFVDLQSGGLRCLVCQAALRDQKEATEHAKQTGHTNFGQQQQQQQLHHDSSAGHATGGSSSSSSAGAAAEHWRRSRQMHT